MPKSHDAKPRNRHRREKYKREMHCLIPVGHPRRRREKVNRYITHLVVCRLNRELAALLRVMGKTWRDYERMPEREAVKMRQLVYDMMKAPVDKRKDEAVA